MFKKNMISLYLFVIIRIEYGSDSVNTTHMYYVFSSNQFFLSSLPSMPDCIQKY
jgi:hypothetical protein